MNSSVPLKPVEYDRRVTKTSDVFWCLEDRSKQQVGRLHLRCTKCHTIKPFEAFHVNNQTRSGRASWCKACRSVDMKQRKAAA